MKRLSVGALICVFCFFLCLIQFPEIGKYAEVVMNRGDQYTPIQVSRRRCEKPTVTASIVLATKRGLGHRLMDMGMTLVLAQKLNVNASMFSHEWHTGGEHGEYTFFPSFSGLNALFHTITPTVNPAISHIDNWTKVTAVDESVFALSPPFCELVFRSCDRCCYSSRKMCFVEESLQELKSSIPEYFEREQFGSIHRRSTVTEVLRWTEEKNNMSAVLSPVATSKSDGNEPKDCITITAHVRIGDRKLGCNFSNNKTVADVVLSLVKELQGACVVVYYMSEAKLAAHHKSCYSRISASMRHHQHQSDAMSSYMLSLRDVEASLRVMIASDIVISTGSSFTLVPTVLSRWVVRLTPTEDSNLADDITYSFSTGVEFQLPYAARSTFGSNVRKYVCNKLLQRRNISMC